MNSSNQLVSAQDYDQWGYILQNRTFSSSKSKFKFTEKERDAESSYDYFGARYYDSRIANFGSVDPLLEKHFDFSPYTYVLRNPLIFIDPDGKQTLASEAIKYTIQTAKTVAPLVGVSLNPIGIILGSLINPSQLGQIAKHNEFLEEQRLWIEELNPRYTTDEIIITSLKSEGDLSKLSGKEVKELAKEEGYEGEKSVEKMKEQVLKDEGISSKEAKRFDVYKDKSTGKHYLKPKQEFEKKFKNKNIPID